MGSQDLCRKLRPSLAVLTLVLGGSAHVFAAPLMYGVDEDDGQLFTIADYDTATPTFTNLGLLKYAGGASFGPNIEAMTLDPNGIVYMALDASVGTATDPVLLTYDIADLETPTPNLEVTIVGSMGIGSPADNVSGLSIDPLTGDLFALLRTDDIGGVEVVDQLYRIPDPLNAPGTSILIGDLGVVGGLQVLNAEDLEFGADGTLYVVENLNDDDIPAPANEDALFEIALQRDGDNNIEAITGVTVLASLESELGADVKFEALGWDFEANDGDGALIGSDDNFDRFAELLPSVSNLGPLGSSGLSDVEGIDFVPGGEAPPPMDPPNGEIPVPGVLSLVGLGLIGLGAARRPRRR